MDEADENTDYWAVLAPVWDVVRVSTNGETYLKSVLAVPSRLAALHAAHLAQSEICNGGFEQFFENPSGVLAPEAVEAFRGLGMPNTADVVASAVRQFGNQFPREHASRQSQLRALEPGLFDGLDEQFFALIEEEAGGFQCAADCFAARHSDLTRKGR